MTLIVDVFFGSQSDEPVYRQVLDLLAKLEITHRLEVCSAHRNPDRLRELIHTSDADLFITGAGLSAHLPGVTAAHTLKPVIGLPCHDVMHGLDALIACMQMPGGVPVLATGVENLSTLSAFLTRYSTLRHQSPRIGILASASAGKWVEQFEAMLAPYPFSLDADPHLLSEEDLLVQFVDLLAPETNPVRRHDALCIPVLPEDRTWDPRILLDLTAQGGLWVGINTYKNAALALIELWNQDRRWDNDLVRARGGVPAHV